MGNDHMLLVADTRGLKEIKQKMKAYLRIEVEKLQDPQKRDKYEAILQ